MNCKSKEVEETYKIFKENYGNALKETMISDIIHGDTITIKPDNILINKDIKFEDSTFEKKLQLCKLKLYNYQKDSEVESKFSILAV